MLPGYTGRYVIHSLDTNGLDIHRSKLKLVQREKKQEIFSVDCSPQHQLFHSTGKLLFVHTAY